MIKVYVEGFGTFEISSNNIGKLIDFLNKLATVKEGSTHPDGKVLLNG